MSKKRSRGRHQRGGRTTPKGTRPREVRARSHPKPRDPESAFLDDARYLVTADDPIEAEEFASWVVSLWHHDEIKRELDAERATTLVDLLGETPRRESLAVLLGLAAVAPAPHAARAAEAARRLATAGVRQPTWAQAVGRAQVTESWIMSHVLGDGVNVVLGGRYPSGHQHTVLVYVDTNLGGLVKDALIAESPIEQILGDLRAQSATHPGVTIEPIDAGDAAARIRDALELNDVTFPQIETDEFPAMRALIEARLSAMPTDGRIPPRAEWPDEQREALIAEFLASPEATEWRDDPKAEEIAFHLVTHGCDYDASGDPLRWSPVVVEVVLCDWFPRKVAGDRSMFVCVPGVLTAFVHFAGHKRGIPAPLVDETVGAIDQFGAEFLELVDDPRAWGPAKSVAQQMQQAGVDLADPEAVTRFIDELNRRPDPFTPPEPHEGFDWTGISTHLEWRARQILEDIDRICASHLDDEYRDRAYDLTRRLTLVRPSPLAKGWPSHWAGAVLYFLGQQRGLFHKHTRPHLPASTLALFAGASSTTLNKKAKQIRELVDVADAAPARQVSPRSASTVHQLKVSLRDVKPPVWRRLVVPSTWTLGQLAPALEATMGWLGYHLHVFEASDVRYGEPDPDWPELRDERRARITDVVPTVGSKMRWDYDFGDGWEHDIVVEAIDDPDPQSTYPHCTAGRRACPPEDCGGPWGYRELLDVLADPAHPDHEELRGWTPPGFDPAAFEARDANLALCQLR